METSASDEDLLAQAASESLRRIDDDRQRVSARVGTLLDYIREHLFDPRLDVNRLKRACNVRDNAVPLRFHSVLGRTPHRYIEDRRLETARRLLTETDLKIWRIAEMVGYSGIQVFSRAFIRWAGEPPSVLRRHRRRPPRPRVPSAEAREPSDAEDSWTVVALRELQAEVVEAALLDQPAAVRHEVLARLRLPAPALVRRLCLASRGARAGPGRVELARLAVAASEALDPRHCGLAERLRWTMEAWTTLADAAIPGGLVPAAANRSAVLRRGSRRGKDRRDRGRGCSRP